MRLRPKVNESARDLTADADTLGMLLDSFTQKESIPKSSDIKKEFDFETLVEACEKKESALKSNDIKKKQKLDQFVERGNDLDYLQGSSDIDTADTSVRAKNSPRTEKSISKLAPYQGSTTDKRKAHLNHRGQAKQRNAKNNLNADSKNETGTKNVDFMTTLLDGTVWDDFIECLFHTDHENAWNDIFSGSKEATCRKEKSVHESTGENIIKLMLQSLGEAFAENSVKKFEGATSVLESDSSVSSKSSAEGSPSQADTVESDTLFPSWNLTDEEQSCDNKDGSILSSISDRSQEPEHRDEPPNHPITNVIHIVVTRQDSSEQSPAEMKYAKGVADVQECIKESAAEMNDSQDCTRGLRRTRLMKLAGIRIQQRNSAK